MMLPYKILTKHGVYNTPNSETLFEEQERKCSEIGIDTKNDIKCHFFDSIFYDDQTSYMNVYEAIQCLAIKDGVDLVQYENGNYGFVAYYNDYKNGFEITGGTI